MFSLSFYLSGLDVKHTNTVTHHLHRGNVVSTISAGGGVSVGVVYTKCTTIVNFKHIIQPPVERAIERCSC